jgi:hypothetical protein
MWWHSSKDQGWLDSYGVEGKESRVPPDIHDPPREGNYSDEHGNTIKQVTVADYNRRMGHVENADRMANSYTASHRMSKWTKKLFFRLLDLVILSLSGGKKVSHRDFRITLIREKLARSGHEPRPSKPVGRPAPASTNIRRLDTTSTGLTTTPQGRDVACFQQGAWRKRWC